jgi:hypothetical protein
MYLRYDFNVAQGSVVDLKTAWCVDLKTGNLGIGTNNPSGPLHVYKAAESMDVYFQTDSGYGQGENVNLIFKNSSYEMSGITGIDEATATNGTFQGGLAFKTTFHVGSTAMKEQMRITSSGKVGIGLTNPAEALTVSGNIVASGNITDQGSVSDRRLKENIANLSSASSLEKVLKMRTVSFKWIDNLANEQRRGKQDEGFIAQEIEEMLPMLVGEIQVEEQDTPYKFIHYDKLTVYMAGAIQEQNKEITELKEENTTLKAQLNSILERLSALESN